MPCLLPEVSVTWLCRCGGRLCRQRPVAGHHGGSDARPVMSAQEGGPDAADGLTTRGASDDELRQATHQLGGHSSG